MIGKRARATCAGLILFAACGETGPGTRADVEPPETTMIPTSRVDAERDSVPERIFYDLTRFEWYARGEPLVWDEREWEPRGAPVAADAEALRRLGDFGGVDVWMDADADSLARLYVPVSEGFWLTFVPVAR